MVLLLLIGIIGEIIFSGEAIGKWLLFIFWIGLVVLTFPVGLLVTLVIMATGWAVSKYFGPYPISISLVIAWGCYLWAGYKQWFWYFFPDIQNESNKSLKDRDALKRAPWLNR